jgi:predicted small lipoprotein YifL
MRPWARTLTIGAAILMAAFVTVQVGGCGLKTPLQLPKKAPAPKPAS